MANNSTAAKDGGANQSKTTMPPVSQEYRDNYDIIFNKHPDIKPSHSDFTVEARLEKRGYRRLSVGEILKASDVYADERSIIGQMVFNKVKAGDFYFRKID